MNQGSTYTNQREQDQITVLVVDDEPTVAELTAEFLNREDQFVANTATGARDALNRLSAETFDCIVSDYQMPELDGLEFLETVREDHPDLPFILFTGQGSEEIASEAILRGVTDYVQKGSGSDRYDLLANRIETAVTGQRAQRQVRRQHQELRDVLESLPAMVCVDIGGECVYVNTRGADLIRVDDPDELIGGSIADFVHPEERDDLSEQPPDGRQRVERRLVTSDGTVRHVEVIKRPITWRGTGATLSLVRDISDRKSRVLELERAKNRYQEIFERSHDAILVLDPYEDEIYDANPQAEDLLGYTDSELQHMSPSDIHPHEMDDFRSFVDSVYETGAGWTEKLSCLTKDGTQIPAEISASVIVREEQSLMLALIRDISRRVEREQVLRTLHDATRDLMEADSRDSIAAIASETASNVLDLPMNAVYLYRDAIDGLVPTATSPRNEAIIGESPTFHAGEGVAWSVFETGEGAIHGDVREAEETYNPETPIRSEAILPLGDHGVFMISSTEIDAFDEADLTLARVLAANVETALDRAAKDEALADRTAEMQRHMDRLEEFASVLSHDLRNPLNVASGRLELARDECNSEHLEATQSALDRMDQLIEQMLTLAQSGQRIGDLEPVELTRLSEECWRTISTAAAEIEVANPPEIRADPEALRQVLENLFANAIDHGGLDVTIRVGALEDGFYVEDSGSGIPEDEREQVFEPGYSTGDDGAGLGLAIVRQIAEAHGWDISVSEGEAGGARFEISGVQSS